jgi:nucleotide-binding universal stress UspA family protein
VFTTIAWATDCSPSARDALAVAVRLARGNAARIVIVHVDELPVGRTVITPGSSGATSAALHRTATELHEQGIEAVVSSTSPASGDVARAIVDLARKAGADVIVAGGRRRGPLARLLHRDIASGLLQSASCPVLIVPSGWKEESSNADTGPAEQVTA